MNLISFCVAVSFLECLQIMKHPILKDKQDIIPVVARVLAWSQGYMRKTKVS